jgi:hypothetical protein
LQESAYTLPTKTIPSALTGKKQRDRSTAERFIEWVLEPIEQRLMIVECLSISEGNCRKNNFLNFLMDKLEIEGYWKMVGLA